MVKVKVLNFTVLVFLNNKDTKVVKILEFKALNYTKLA